MCHLGFLENHTEIHDETKKVFLTNLKIEKPWSLEKRIICCVKSKNVCLHNDIEQKSKKIKGNHKTSFRKEFNKHIDCLDRKHSQQKKL